MPTCHECARLRRELAEARRELARREVASEYAIPRRLGLSDREARAMGCLLARPVATHGMIDAATGARTPAAHVIHHLRRKLAPHGITVESSYGVGWYLPDAERARLMRGG